VAEKVLGMVAEKTGYPRDMLELDLDLEADLGIDTVKQAEVFALVRETFSIPRQDTVKLRDYPTLRHVIGFVEQNRPDLQRRRARPRLRLRLRLGHGVGYGTGSGSDCPHRGRQRGQPTACFAVARRGHGGIGKSDRRESSGAGGGQDRVPAGHAGAGPGSGSGPGIDTVKQAEVFALVREAFSIRARTTSSCATTRPFATSSGS